MKPPFAGPDGAASIAGAALLEVLDELCERRAYLQLATPYLSFPAHALERRGEELRLRITLTQDFVTRTLGQVEVALGRGANVLGDPVMGFRYLATQLVEERLISACL